VKGTAQILICTVTNPFALTRYDIITSLHTPTWQGNLLNVRPRALKKYRERAEVGGKLFAKWKVFCIYLGI
jgi:hypothetical protein